MWYLTSSDTIQLTNQSWSENWLFFFLYLAHKVKALIGYVQNCYSFNEIALSV